MTSRPLVILGFVIVIIAGIAAAGYIISGQGDTLVNGPDTSVPIVSTSAPSEPSDTNATSTSTTASSTLPAIPLPGQRNPPINTSSWFINVDDKLGYSIEYPSDLITGQSGDRFTLVFPKNTYFHWPLLDDVKVTISVASSCPKTIEGGPTDGQPVEFSLNGYSFVRTMGTDVGAGQRYEEIAYDLLQDGSCYRVSLLGHGANGAGFYVDDAALVKKYDAQHEADMEAVVDILNGMVGTLRILAQKH